MAFDAYAVAVKITLANHVSSGLKIVRDEVQSTGFEVGRLNTKLEFLARNARDAWAALRSGRDIASVFRGPANDASRYQRELDTLHKTLAKPFAPAVMPVFHHSGATPPGGSGGSGVPPIIPVSLPGGSSSPSSPHSPQGIAAAYHSAMSGMMAGGMMVGGGMLIAGAMKGPMNEAIEYQRELAKLQQYGLGSSQIDEAQKFVSANEIIGTSLKDRIQLFADSQGAFRESGMSGSHALDAAKVMMPVLARYQTATAVLGGHASEDQLQQMNKTVELMGGLNDPRRAEEIANGIFKAVQSSGKMVTNRDLRQLITQGGVSVAGLTDRAIFAGLEPIIGEFGGSATGTGLQTAFSRSHGMMALTPSITTNEMLRLGVWDADKVTRTKGGGARFEHGSPMEAGLAKLQETDVVQFSKAMTEIYKKNGITSITDMGRENNILFGRTGGKIYTKVMQQLEVLERSEKAFDNSRGINQTVGDNANSPTMKMLAFHKAVDDLGLAIGNVLLPVMMPMITSLTSFAHELSKHPALVKGLTYALIGLSAFLITGGLINMIISAGKGFWLVGQALWFVGGKALGPLLPMLARFGTYLVMFIADFAKVMLVLGRALLLNPIGLAIMGIAAAGFLLWNNWKEISANLKIMWNGMKTGFTQLFSGDLMGALKTFAHVWLLGWQTIFNTLIAGANKILPASYQLSKVSFADTQSAPVPAKDWSRDPLIVHMHMDGKKVAEVVVDRMAKAASRPLTSTNGFDPSRSPIMPGSPSMAYLRN